jgi:hypothetical protein
VLGVQKSGTTAIASLLALLTTETLASDFTQRDPAGFRTRVFDREIPFSEVVRRHRRSFDCGVVKDPNLTFFAEDLLAMFEKTRFVFVCRDPRETIRSQLDWMGLPGDELEIDTATVSRASWRMLLDGRWPRVQGASYIERLAARWCLGADIFLARRSDLRLMRYEDFESDKVGALHRLAFDVGLSPSADVVSEVDTQFQPRGNRRPWLQVFGEHNLRLIESTCARQMEELAYGPGDS